MAKYKDHRGFTLAELLIVVAIISVLVAISIPIFNSQLEKAREAADIANVRSAYAEIMSAVITEDKSAAYFNSSEEKWSIKVFLKQKKDGWTMSTPITIGGVTSSEDGGSNNTASGMWIGRPKAGGICEICYSKDNVFSLQWGEDNAEPDPGGGSGGSGGSTEQTLSHLYDSARDFPTSASESISYNPGEVYHYNGKVYVSLAAGSYNQYNQQTPENTGDWGFVELKTDTRILTEMGHFGTGVERGDVFKTNDGKYYIRKYSQEWWDDPIADPGNWQLIN